MNAMKLQDKITKAIQLWPRHKTKKINMGKFQHFSCNLYKSTNN